MLIKSYQLPMPYPTRKVSTLVGARHVNTSI